MIHFILHLCGCTLSWCMSLSVGIKWSIECKDVHVESKTQNTLDYRYLFLEEPKGPVFIPDFKRVKAPIPIHITTIAPSVHEVDTDVIEQIPEPATTPSDVTKSQEEETKDESFIKKMTSSTVRPTSRTTTAPELKGALQKSISFLFFFCKSNINNIFFGEKIR